MLSAPNSDRVLTLFSTKLHSALHNKSKKLNKMNKN